MVFGRDYYVGFSRRSRLSTTAANVHYITEAENLIHVRKALSRRIQVIEARKKREELKNIEADWLIAATYKKESAKQGASSQKTLENK